VQPVKIYNDDETLNQLINHNFSDLCTNALKRFAVFGLVLGGLALIVTAIALAICFPPVFAAIAGSIGIISAMGSVAFAGVAVGAGLLTVAGFLIGSRAIHLLCIRPEGEGKVEKEIY
jgi:hypothetical protein